MTIAPAVLDDILASLDVGLGRTRRHDLTAGGTLVAARGSATLVYVVDGELTGDAVVHTDCLFDAADGATHTVGARRTLLAGDAFLTMGRDGTLLESESGARLVTAEVEIVPTASARAIPDTMFVTRFAALEPAAAALAAELGPSPDTADAVRSGDPVICRLMVTTVLLSMIRAWARAGCAPRGWPTVATDPFLGRVVAAIHDDPGREWTLDQLAAAGAMSRTVFAERFRAALGQSPASYLADVRMQRAKDLLAAGRSVSETSRALGYASDEGFSRAFRRRTGVVPSLWRGERRGAAVA